MDKRTIIGLVLVAVVVLLLPFYQKYISGPQRDQAVAPAAGESSAERVPEPLSESPGHESALPASGLAEEPGRPSAQEPDAPEVPLQLQGAGGQLVDFQEMKVTVETPLYIAKFSNLGAHLVSFKLKEYRRQEGDLVEMVSPFVEQELIMELNTSKGTFSTAELPFFYDGDSLIILEEAQSSTELNFTSVLPGGMLMTRVYKLNADNYLLDHHVETHFSDSLYIDQTVLWWQGGLYPTENDVKQEMRFYKFCDRMGGEFNRESFKAGKEISIAKDGSTDWVATTTKYFVVILASIEEKFNGSIARGGWHTTEFDKATVELPQIGIGLLSDERNNAIVQDYRIYLGPQDYFDLKKLGEGFHEVVDLGWKYLAPLASGLLWVFIKINTVVSNYGLVIIIFSLLIKFILYPLTRKQMKSMMEMKQLEPKMKVIREEFKNDPQKLNEQVMKLYKEHGVNPLGGCFPLVLQMPIFFALFRVFYNTIELRAQPFIFWIKDLSQKDPYYALPLMMCAIMFVQQQISIKDPKQKLMGYIMPIFFFFIFRNMPSGLVLYWTTFNVLSVVHQYMMELGNKRKLEADGVLQKADK
ncbi:membrane protein insertase YidC [bacterium]|nr:membrane protein insertase YidC [bacterium]